MILRIGIEATGLIIQPKTGVEHYTTQLILALAKEAARQDDLCLHLYVHTGSSCADPSLLSAYAQQLGGMRLHTYAPRRWYRLGLEMMAKRDRLDLLHLPMPFPPALHWNRTLTTIHDLHWDTMSDPVRAVIRGAIEKSDYLLAVSEETRRSLLGQFKTELERVFLIHEGVTDQFCPSVEEAERVKRKYVLDSYILCTGTFHPRKNHLGLVQAYARLRAERGIRQQLVLAGGDGAESAAVRERIARLGLDSAVRMLGYLPDEDLCGLYAGADVFVLPSFYEGFGLPVIEAMACGAPVATANTGSLPEIAGEAALYFDPCDSNEMAEKIFQILSNATLRAGLIKKGALQASRFRWPGTAQKTLDAYRLIAANR